MNQPTFEQLVDLIENSGKPNVGDSANLSFAEHYYEKLTDSGMDLDQASRTALLYGYLTPLSFIEDVDNCFNQATEMLSDGQPSDDEVSSLATDLEDKVITNAYNYLVERYHL